MPGRGNLQIIGGVHRILDVERGRNIAGKRLAVADGHRAVGPLGHDLHGISVQRGNLDAHQAEAEAFGYRLDNAGNASLDTGLGNYARFLEIFQLRGCRHLKHFLQSNRSNTERSGSGRTHSQDDQIV